MGVPFLLRSCYSLAVALISYPHGFNTSEKVSWVVHTHIFYFVTGAIFQLLSLCTLKHPQVLVQIFTNITIFRLIHPLLLSEQCFFIIVIIQCSQLKILKELIHNDQYCFSPILSALSWWWLVPYSCLLTLLETLACLCWLLW